MPTLMPTVTTPPQLVGAERLIIATNRGPVEYYLTQDKELKYRRGAGGMVTALMGTGNRMDVTWVAMAMTEGDRIALKQAQQNAGLLQSPLPGQKMQLRYVAIPKPAYRKHYDQISNQVLWFLQHYLYDRSEEALSDEVVQDAWENGYCRANQAIAKAICAELEHDNIPGVVMLHDYHLYLASAIIRECRPDVVMQQFIHIPWPEVRYWQQCLPSKITQAIFKGLLGNDIVGFQTRKDEHNFLEGVDALLEGAEVNFEDGTIDWQGHCTKVQAYPISISVLEERRIVQSRAGKHAAEKIRGFLSKQMQTIMRVDRLEPTKNIVRGFQAYAQLLEEHPELRGKVTFLAFLVPSRQTLSKYQRYKDDVLKIIEDINKKYGSAEWTPVHTFLENDRTQALAAMQYYDVLLVNPLIDGMNLVAKEGPVVNKKDGMLVLSNTAGAFQQLGKFSIPISPTDTAETAAALYKALMMPLEERHLKATMASQSIERHNLNKWMTGQMSDINAVIESGCQPNVSDELDEIMKGFAVGVG